MSSETEGSEQQFDFSAHRRAAVDAYRPLAPLYGEFASTLHGIIRARLEAADIEVNATDQRGKSIDSFGDKAAKPAEDDPDGPKYRNPVAEITDLAGVRVITNYISTEADVDRVLEAEFEVVEKSNKTDELYQEERFGYQSIHYLVRLRANRAELPEYERYKGLIAEIQVRTVLQHAWAEIEHDIQYKSATSLPAEIRRRFMTLAGILEMADREVQAIQDESQRVRAEARESVAAGAVTEVEITPESLKAYLDQAIGADDRMRPSSYQYEVRVLRRLGFATLGQLQDAMSFYDDDEIGRIVHGGRQGQLTRLETVLLAALGDDYVRRHPFARNDEWFARYLTGQLTKLRDGGVEVGLYVPDAPVFGS